MSIRKIVNGELRGYLHHNGRWCHVYIMGSYDQTTLVGEPVRMLYFKLTKNSKDILSAEKIKFHKRKPTTQKSRNERIA